MARRLERVNELIREEISELIHRQLKDPRLAVMISITAVDTTPDLRHARVYVSILGTEAEQRDVMRGLRAAAGFMRRELGSRLTMRHVPELEFRQDKGIERGTRILQLLKEVSNED